MDKNKEIAAYFQRFQTNEAYLIGPMCAAKPKFSEPCLFVDGGARYQHNNGISLGDGDSYSGQLDIVLPQEKDFSDLAYALFQIPNRIQIIHLKGFWGGRMDHLLFNLGESIRYLSKQRSRMIDCDGEAIGFAAGSYKLSYQGRFSLFCFQDARIQIQGDALYKTEATDLFHALSSKGLSNQAHGVFSIESDSAFLFLFDQESSPDLISIS